MPLLSVCDDVTWNQIALPMIGEAFSRQVIWICKDNPHQLGLQSRKTSVDLAKVNLPKDPKQRRSFKDMDRIKSSWESQLVSNRFWITLRVA